MKRLVLRGSLCAAMTLAAGHSIAADIRGQITNVIGPASAKLGPGGTVGVSFNVTGQEPSLPPPFSQAACRYTLRVDNSAGVTSQQVFSDSNRPMFPKHALAVFLKVGNYVVTAIADASSGCEGIARANITIDPSSAPTPTPPPANPCPAGWTKKPGPPPASGFECVPVKPTPMPCPPGTKWFDEGGTIGCRP